MVATVSSESSFAPSEGAAGAAADTKPDFGPDVLIVDTTMSIDEINALIAPRNGDPFRQIFFMPGTYGSSSGQDDPERTGEHMSAGCDDRRLAELADQLEQPDEAL